MKFKQLKKFCNADQAVSRVHIKEDKSLLLIDFWYSEIKELNRIKAFLTLHDLTYNEEQTSNIMKLYLDPKQFTYE